MISMSKRSPSDQPLGVLAANILFLATLERWKYLYIHKLALAVLVVGHAAFLSYQHVS